MIAEVLLDVVLVGVAQRRKHEPVAVDQADAATPIAERRIEFGENEWERVTNRHLTGD